MKRSFDVGCPLAAFLRDISTFSCASPVTNHYSIEPMSFVSCISYLQFFPWFRYSIFPIETCSRILTRCSPYKAYLLFQRMILK